MIKKFFAKEKENKKAENDIPAVLVSKYNKFNILTIIILIVGLIVCFVMYSGFAMFKAMLLPILISGILFAEGQLYKRNLTQNGFNKITGICIDHKHNIGAKLLNADFSIRKQVTSLIIECENKIISIPVAKLNDIPPIGNKVIVYIPPNALERINNNGITIYSQIYGYEIIPDKENPEEEIFGEE